MNIDMETAAKCLKLTSKTVERWARQGRIPSIRDKGGSYRFDTGVLRKWAGSHRLPFRQPPANTRRAENGSDTKLTTILGRGGVFYDLAGEDVREVLCNAVGMLKNLNLKQKQLLYDRLLEREELTSTGIGHGIAIPHPRAPVSEVFETASIAVFFLKHPIDYQAVDQQPVFALFMLMCQDIKSHLHWLSKLSFCLRNEQFVALLKRVPSQASLMQSIDQIEAGTDQ